MLTEIELHAKRHKRVLTSRSRIAHKARRDTQLRAEAEIKRVKSAQWLQELALLQKKSEIEANKKHAQQLAAATQRQKDKGWLAGAASKAVAFLRRGR